MAGAGGDPGSVTPEGAAAEPSSLEALRERIDEVDREIQDAITRRARLAGQIARAKGEAGDDSDFYRPDREARILREVMARNAGPLPAEDMARLFREIMSACLALQKPLQVAYLGPAGTFTQAAVHRHFGHGVRTSPFGAIDQVFREVEAGAAHYGVVPVENSTEGVVTHTLDSFVGSPLRICGEVTLRIHHCLFARGVVMEEVRKVYSHQQSLAQCRDWLDVHLPGRERIGVSSNAEAARRAAAEPRAGAVAGRAAGELYELDLLAANIEDAPNNTTRFLVIGHRSVPPTGDDKTSLLVSGTNRAGLLHDLLRPLAGHGLSMTRLESRPARRGQLWEYVFFIDIEGHGEDPAVSAALAEMRQSASLLKVLGSYPRAAV